MINQELCSQKDHLHPVLRRIPVICLTVSLGTSIIFHLMGIFEDGIWEDSENEFNHVLGVLCSWVLTV